MTGDNNTVATYLGDEDCCVFSAVERDDLTV